jgi:hypothetical protein
VEVFKQENPLKPKVKPEPLMIVTCPSLERYENAWFMVLNKFFHLKIVSSDNTKKHLPNANGFL